MFKVLHRWLMAAAALLLISGCTSRLNVAEMLQQPQNKTVRTYCNLWYDDDRNINCMNYQTGKILPWGTEVNVTEVTKSKITFTANGVEFRIQYYPEWTMIPVESYIRQTFTLKTRAELGKGVAPKVLDEIDRGRIVKGMTRDEVSLCCGWPVACRTPSRTNDTWIYWTDHFTTIRVVFKNNKVVDVLSLQ